MSKSQLRQTNIKITYFKICCRNHVCLFCFVVGFGWFFFLIFMWGCLWGEGFLSYFCTMTHITLKESFYYNNSVACYRLLKLFLFFTHLSAFCIYYVTLIYLHYFWEPCPFMHKVLSLSRLSAFCIIKYNVTLCLLYFWEHVLSCAKQSIQPSYCLFKNVATSFKLWSWLDNILSEFKFPPKM